MSNSDAILIAKKPVLTRSEKTCLECGIPFPAGVHMHMFLYKLDENKYDRKHLCFDCKKYYQRQDPPYSADAGKLKGIILG